VLVLADCQARRGCKKRAPSEITEIDVRARGCSRSFLRVLCACGRAVERETEREAAAVAGVLSAHNES
jgi:hypothetical protein